MTNTTTNTALVTTENVNWMKCHILKCYGIGRVCADYINEVNNITEMFDYENEEVETIVFGYVLGEAKRWIDEASSGRKWN